jgi:hypothetical protein
VNPFQVLPHPPGYISLLMTTPSPAPPGIASHGLPGRRATVRGLRGRGARPGLTVNWPIRVCPKRTPPTGQFRVCPKRPGIRVRVPPSGPWPPRPRNRLASQGSAHGHAPRRRSPAALAPPPATGQRPRSPGTAHLGCPTGTAARPPPRLEGCRHGGHARRRERRGNPRTRPPSGLPLGPGRHACLSHCPPARDAAPDPPPQSIDPPAGPRWPGGFSPLYILSDPTWVGKRWATLRVYKKFSWGPP